MKENSKTVENIMRNNPSFFFFSEIVAIKKDDADNHNRLRPKGKWYLIEKSGGRLSSLFI